ncbi:protocadherin Fat 3-like isoform 10-T12 [Spinachia spinachia]
MIVYGVRGTFSPGYSKAWPGWWDDGMEVKMGQWVGMRGLLLVLALLLPLLLFKPTLCYGQNIQYGFQDELYFGFTLTVYHATLHENSAARTYANSKVKMGIHLGQRSWEIRYRITSGDDEGFFKAEEYVLGDFCFLRIRTKGGNAAILNREIQDNYVLTVKASVKGDTLLETWTKVSIQVLDMNDLRPLFSPTTYSVNIAESTPLRTSIAQVTATDADIGSNGEFYYFFKEKIELFAVHPTSGVVSLSGKLNVDEQNRYDLEILAVDRGMKLYGNNGVSSTAKLFVHVERVNEHAPVMNVVTHSPLGLDKNPVYAMVTVDDFDEGLNGEVDSVVIVGGDPIEQFYIERFLEGVFAIKASESFNPDNYPYGCNLTLQAKDRGAPQKFSAVNVIHIMVKIRQTAEAAFERELYDLSLNEISPPGTIVEAVKISPEPDNVEYVMTPSADSAFFRINTLTGVISTTQWFTQVSQNVFNLELVEIESDVKVKVRVTIEDANDNPPTFVQASYDVLVNESILVGTNILAVSAVDEDEGENGYITYSISSIQPLPFKINQFSGIISISKELDFESSPESFVFLVRASDWGSPYRRESEVNVTVRLENVNDNQPLFEMIACHGVISRDFAVNEVITTMSAIDIDELELVKYKILSGNEWGYFDLNPDSGVLSLQNSLASASPKNSFFSLRITATDGENFSDPMFVNISVGQGKSPPKSFNCKETRVAQKLAEKLLKKSKTSTKLQTEEGFIDLFSVNRQAPQFDKAFPKSIAVWEDLKMGSSVFKVNAFDGDTGFNGQILYSISDGNTDSCFTIDMESGLISVFLPMDREKMDRYFLNLTIYDLGLPQKTDWRLLTVYIEDANDNAPQFLEEGGYSIVIPENTVIGTDVIQVEATDKDLGPNGEVVYSVLTGTSLFGINYTNGIVYVAGQLDREFGSAFNLKIEARDKGVKGGQRFSVINMKVVLEDVNDCPPLFIPNVYKARALEDLPVGTVVAWLETQDPDTGLGGQVRYSLVNDYNGWFEVDRASGALRLTKELDYETQQFYNLTVKAKDKGKPVSLLSVTFVEVEVVDVNENLYAPYFSHFALTGLVKENARIGTSLLQVTASDDDTGRDGEIQYSIHDGSGLGRFAIDEETGVIYTTDMLDRETKDSYWLTVYASDHGVVPQFATIEVFVQVEDVNDNAPLTSEPLYRPSVPENSPRDLSVIQIQAQDPDALPSAASDRLNYRIISGNPQNFFTINIRSGLITTTSRKLDREQQTEHVLEVVVSDGGPSPRQSTVWVMVQVLDENDNKPTFPQKVYQVKLPERERRKKGEPIYRVFAYDRDEGSNSDLSYNIVDGNEEGKFFIDPKTAVVSSRKAFTAGSYDILSIKATDNGRPQKSSTARLHIEWIRRSSPSTVPVLFDEPFYNFTIMENDKVAEIVGLVSLQQSSAPLWFDITEPVGPSCLTFSSLSLLNASCLEGPRSFREMFYILQSSCGRNCSSEGGNSDSMFDVEKAVGTIVIAKLLDAEQLSFYNLTVQATDGTNTAYTQVHITVLDNNDNAPIFSQPTYDVTISEDTLPDTEVVQVLASDRDEHHWLIYSLQSSIDPSSMRLFRIHPTLGTIYTTQRLDHEACAQHILTVIVKDQEFPYRKNLARVLIEVEDINDHVPIFTSALYEGSVYESAAVGSAVVQVTALDKDKGVNAELHYSIEAGNTGNTFDIEPILGLVTVARDLDLSSIGYYILTVRVTDNGSPPLSTTTIVRIAVTLSDNAGPKFPQPEYQAEITEKAVMGTSVTTVSAASQSTLTYDIKQGNTDQVFQLNQYSGVISTQKSLDYETTGSYILIVQATNMAGMASNVTLIIQVVDENDNPPVFQQLHYHGSISEAAPVNSLVLNSDDSPLVIKATDADRNQNALLVYQIVEETAKIFFTVDSGTGSIRTIANLDHETFSTFRFHVHVRDNGKPQLTAESPTEVTIQVIDTNDSPPRFTQNAYEIVLLLPTYVGVEVLQVSALDPDEDVPSGLTYTLIDGVLQYFAIKPSNGVITVKHNNFSKERFRFSVKVSDGKFSSTAMVTIIVRKALDSGLSFTNSLYTSSIQENVSNITKVAVVNAVGNRLNEPLKYTLLNAGTRFKISPTSGVIQTTGIPFDREEHEFYELVVEARREHDHFHVARVMVTVHVEDINDNAPVFVGLPYYAAVQVDAEPRSPIFRVMAVDCDKGINGEVSYYLKYDHGHFEINQQTGGLSLKRPFESDLSNMEYQMEIHARDGGYPPILSTIEFPITVVNKAMPVFDKPFYSVSVNEDVAVHTPILGINATSPEGQNIIYTIVDGDPSLQFDIGFDTGVISVIHSLDYEAAVSYHMTIRATDYLTGARAEVDVDVVIRDVNDNQPIFHKMSYRVVLCETVMIGTPALQVIATDKDSEKNNVVLYQIFSDGQNSTDYFHIDSSSGLILSARMLDHELVQKYDFIVRATDNGFPPMSSEVSVIIVVNDMNDNPPVFNQLLYEAYVNELAPRGHFVTCVQASDADSSDFEKLEYSILSGNDRIHFLIDNNTGILTVSSHHKQRMDLGYTLNVSVSDGVFTSTAQVHVKVLGANLYSPVFGQHIYEAELKENAPVGTKVIQVKATDADPWLDHIIYSFVNDVGKDQFSIDENGQITTAEKLDREDPANKDIVLAVAAQDPGGRVSYCTVQVNLSDDNDNVPCFRATEYRASVKSDVSKGFLVTQIQAYDPDDGTNAKVTYSLYSEAPVPMVDILEIDPDNGWMVTKGGNYRGVFALGLVQGEWKMYVKRPLDREERNLYIINVTASDGLFVSQATVEVTVIDTNDNSPICDQAVYTASVSENLPVNSVLLRIGAADADIGVSAWLQYSLHGPGSQDFTIDPDTGEVKSSIILDHEMTPCYRLIALATDGGGRWCRAEVQLAVTDINDNPPIFTLSEYTASVYEDTATKALLTRIQAIDPDEGPGRMVVYSLADSAEGSFSIDKSSGIVVLERILDREVQAAYQITVHAFDQGSPLPLSSSVNVIITVLDINDNPPVFERRDQLATVPEDMGVGTEVLRIYAASKDIGTNAEINYSIRSGNDHGKFHIHPLTGAIFVAKPLDYETCREYFLTVQACDGGTPPLSAITTVNINLTDVNDNAPMFPRDIYAAVVSEDATTGESVVQVIAEDVDGPLNGAILYSLVSGDRDTQFFIDPLHGIIKVIKPLDRETVPRYSLTIRALDSGIPPMSSTVMVNLEVSDINDNPPTFYPANLTTVIQENKPIGTSILQLSVNDEDSSCNGEPFDFRILSGNEGGQFVLEKDGTLVANQVFRRDLATEHAITIQVTDSGKPRLSSISMLTVRVIEESLHRPVALPLQVHIVTMEDEFPGGVIGQLHATDADPYDALTFGHTPLAPRSLFKISPRDGKIIALGGLDAGRYSLNASVSDGRFAVPVPVSVHVEQVTPEMLREAVTIRFESVAPQDFVALHLKSMLKVLRKAASSQQRDKLHLLSLQPVGGTQQLDMLVSVETTGGGYYKTAYLTQKLSASRRQLEEVLKVSAILDKNCSGLECRGAQCEQSILLDSHSLATYSTPRVSFVSPRFHRTSHCTCNDANCAVLSEQCERQPCPADMQCVSIQATRGHYVCQCPTGKLGECAGHSSLSFSGNSYIKYRLSSWLQEELKVSLRIRTLQSRGIIMYTHTEPCLVLKLEDGKLWLQLACGLGSDGGDNPDLLGISGHHINDGSWHTVALELNRNFSSVALDDSYVERRRAAPFTQPLAPDRTIYFGALVQHPNSRRLLHSHRDPQVLEGFQGCLDSVTLNNNVLPLQNKRSRYAEVVGLTDLKLGCILYPDACLQQPCHNAATCTSLPSGGFSCSCKPQYTGGHCEMEITACIPNPCQNGGACRPIGNAFLCNCRRGFKGLICEEDVNECAQGNPDGDCDNSGVCVNTYGSFYCNCTAGFVGQRCGLRPVVVPDMQAGHTVVGKEELIGIAVVLLVIVTLIIVFIAFRKKVFQKNYSRNNLSLVQDPATAALLNKANGVQFKTLLCTPGDPLNLYSEPGHGAIVPGGGGMMGPPQVPVRPMAYTPCFQGDPRSTLEKLVDGRGVEHTEMSTFHPESPRILSGTTRRGVVVCSVAPNLPPVSHCRSDCDSLRKSSWDVEGEMVDMAEEVTCFSGSNRSSNSEVQSLSSFQCDACDDNASIVTVIRLVNDAVDTIESEVSVMDYGQTYNKAYHWDTSDWMPSTRLSDIEEVPGYAAGTGIDVLGTDPHLGGSTRELESDYYLGGYDIDSDYPPPHEEEFFSQDQLLPALPTGEDYAELYTPLPTNTPISKESTLSSGSTGHQHALPHFHPSQYLPPHQLPVVEASLGDLISSLNGVSPGNGDTDVQLSVGASSASNMLAHCSLDDTEHGSNFASTNELCRGVTIITDSQQQTQV